MFISFGMPRVQPDRDGFVEVVRGKGEGKGEFGCPSAKLRVDDYCDNVWGEYILSKRDADSWRLREVLRLHPGFSRVSAFRFMNARWPLGHQDYTPLVIRGRERVVAKKSRVTADRIRGIESVHLFSFDLCNALFQARSSRGIDVETFAAMISSPEMSVSVYELNLLEKGYLIYSSGLERHLVSFLQMLNSISYQDDVGRPCQHKAGGVRNELD